MFGSRRRRPPKAPLTMATVNPNASTAAAAAFMSASGQNQNRSLSSAAAAAALRARPHTPTNVAEVQTKRTMRRSPSVSSTASAGGRNPERRLERRGSSGSMTERTFRSPSPHRNQPGQAPQPQQQSHPPVPAIPAGHRKSTSTSSASVPGVGMQTFRTASQKMDAGLPSWYTNPTGDKSNVRTTDAPMTSAPRHVLPETESIMSMPQRSDSRNSSVNFSYPHRPRAQSPPASPAGERHPQWNHPPTQTPTSPPRSSKAGSTSTLERSDLPMMYDANSRRMVPKLDLMDSQRQVINAAEKQPKKKKKDSGLQRSGSHLAKGTVARVQGTVVEPSGQEHELPRREQPLVEAQPTQDEARALEQHAVKAIFTAPPPKEKLVGETSEGSHERTSSLQSSRAVAKKPSTVLEDLEDDSDAEPAFVPSREVLDTLDAVPTRRLEPQVEEQKATGSTGPIVNWSHAHPESVPSGQQEKKPSLAENKPVAGLSRDHSSNSRSASNSPVRTARFANSPSENLAVRHQPLPRSASPIKSALKRSSPSSRDASPSENGSELAISRGASPETIPRKKAVRVSFDDRNTMVVGESAAADEAETPVASSPLSQSKRPWYSNIGRNKKKEMAALDDDEVMKPRPALPSFGSVREKKLREAGSDERPLVRPHEPALSTATSTPESSVRPYSPVTTGESNKVDSSAAGSAAGPSSDHAIGAILTQEQASRNEANISRFREPLPPVVTSIEGNGYHSSNSTASDSEEDQFDSGLGDSDTENIPSTQTTQISPPETHNNSQNGSTILEEKIPVITEPLDAQRSTQVSQDIPAISISQPSPGLPDQTAMATRTPRPEYFDVPGGFPEDDSDDNQVHENAQTKSGTTHEEANAATTIFEPEAEVLPSQASSLPQTTLVTTPHLAVIEDESEDDSLSNASIYSDAYEDLSDLEGDGFLSLDAVVESPITKEQPRHIAELPADRSIDPESPSPESRPAVMAQFIAHGPGAGQSGDDWEQAKSFWRSLTTAKRRQLEREALAEAAADGDRDEVDVPVRRLSSRKKTAEQRQAVAIGLKAREPARTTNSDRVYMIKPGSKANHGPDSPTPAPGRMRASMRGGPPAKAGKVVQKSTPGDVHLRKSMRGNEGNARTDTRTSHAPAAQSQRPTSLAAGTMRPKAAAQTHQRAASYDVPSTTKSAAVAKQTKPTLQRRGSDASDSSFKRARAAPNEGGFAFRRTMRQASAPRAASPEVKGSGRFSLRSLSPPSSRFRRGSDTVSLAPASTGMRQSLRSGSETSTREEKRSSMTFPSFGRSSKASSTAPKAAKRSSRFSGGSSDEDEPAASAFRSRFVDSSDEEDARPSSSSARPISRGTLRNSGTAPSFAKSATVPEEESAELLDSDEDVTMQIPSPLASPQGAFRPSSQRTSSGIGTSTLRRSGSGRGVLPASATMPTTLAKERRGSFMSNILRRNKKADKTGKITRSDVMESAARRDTKLERNPSELRELRNDSQPQVGSPKLQKKNPLDRGDSWPLPDVERPSTANGYEASVKAQSVRPDYSARRSTSLGIPGLTGLGTTTTVGVAHDTDSVTGTVTGTQKKKKKFGALRRMFRLDD